MYILDYWNGVIQQILEGEQQFVSQRRHILCRPCQHEHEANRESGIEGSTDLLLCKGQQLGRTCRRSRLWID